MAASPFRPGLRCPCSDLLSQAWNCECPGEPKVSTPAIRGKCSYHAYGAEVRAVADTTVVLAKDGLPDNIPRTAAGFETAVPVTMETIAGNSLLLDLGDGHYAYYAHLKPGSVRVRTGDRVRRGEVVGAIGNLGDAREPHLHFQVTDSPNILASEGFPYVIDRFRMKLSEGSWQERRNEFPLGNAVIDFDAR